MRRRLRTGRALFAAVAPRLERAHRERRLEVAALHRTRRRLVQAELHKESLLAHRELQLQRAFAAGKMGYVRHRKAKLEQAQRELASVREKLTAVTERLAA